MARCAHAPWPPNTIPSRGRVYYVSHDWRIRILHAMLPSEGCVLFLCSSMTCVPVWISNGHPARIHQKSWDIARTITLPGGNDGTYGT